jgi:hypothetical protein
MLSRPRTEQFTEEELIREIVSMIESHETRTGALVEYTSLKHLFYSFFVCNHVELFDTLMLKYETFFEFFENKRFVRVMKMN